MAEGYASATAPELALAGDMQEKWHIPTACGPRWLSAEICSFKCWAPHGEDVTVEFEEEGGKVRELKLTRDGDFWAGECPCVPGSRYRIAMGSSWNDCFQSEGARLLRRDPCARECDFESTWSILHPPLRPPKAWNAPKFNEIVMYEIHLGSWVPPDQEHRAYAWATEKLQYIADLGFNAIQLMPTAEFGGIWGYNSRQLLASHGPWGSRADLLKFVDTAHSIGLAVIFDLVLNHGSSKKNTLWNWDGFGPDNCGGIYFEGEKDTPWGKRFAFHKPAVQDYLKQSCRVSIEEYGADGLRFDSVHNMPWWLLQMLTKSIKEHYPDKILIAEITPENPAVINDAGFHSCWFHPAHFDSIKLMKRCDGGEDPGRAMKMLKNMVQPHGFGNIGAVQSALGSHDQVGDRHDGRDENGKHRYYVTRLGGKSNWHARAQVRAWFSFQNCCKGLPMTFMGTEILQDDWWHVDQHHRMNWGLAEGQDAFTDEMKRCVAASNKLRIATRALVEDNCQITHEDPGNMVLAFARHAEGAPSVCCIVHLGEGQWENNGYGVNSGCGGDKKLVLKFNSQAQEFGGWEGSASQEVTSDGSGKIHISIPKWSTLVYQVS